MRWSREVLLRALVAPAVAVALTLIYFAIFDRWNSLADPINSIVTLALGVVGAAAAAGLDRWRVARVRRRSDTQASGSAG
jgi:hypothetical protein